MKRHGPCPSELARRKRLAILACAAVLGGCAGPGSRGPSDEDLQAARAQMADTKKDYELCLRDQEEELDVDCEDFRDIYEEDREAYELLKARRQNARRTR